MQSLHFWLRSFTKLLQHTWYLHIYDFIGLSNVVYLVQNFAFIPNPSLIILSFFLHLFSPYLQILWQNKSKILHFLTSTLTSPWKVFVSSLFTCSFHFLPVSSPLVIFEGNQITSHLHLSASIPLCVEPSKFHYHSTTQFTDPVHLPVSHNSPCCLLPGICHSRLSHNMQASPLLFPHTEVSFPWFLPWWPFSL